MKVDCSDSDIFSIFSIVNFILGYNQQDIKP
jgi:hypothetical protein